MKNDAHTSAFRNYGVDLLRIVSMLMVVLLHVLECGGILRSNSTALNNGVAWSLDIAAYCAVNCYALISGYVGIRSKHKMSSLTLLWVQVTFYSVLIALFFLFAYPETLGFKELIKSFFPVTFFQYWYFTAYFGMFFFIPLMDVAVDKLPKAQMGIILVTSAIFLTPANLLTGGMKLAGGYSVAWLMFLYLTGAYISKHQIFKKTSPAKALCVYLGSVLITIIPKILGDLPFFVGTVVEKYSYTLINYTSPTILVAGISLLIVFSNLKVPQKSVKFISFFSSLSFSVYLIHTHPLVFDYIFKDSFAFLAQKPLWMMIIGIFASTLAVYLVCVFIDYLRFLLFRFIKLKQRLIFLESETHAFLQSKLSKTDVD